MKASEIRTGNGDLPLVLITLVRMLGVSKLNLEEITKLKAEESKKLNPSKHKYQNINKNELMKVPPLNLFEFFFPTSE